MRLTPAQRRDIRRWTAANQRARRAYEAQPSSDQIPIAAQCDDHPWCSNRAKARGLCDMHYRRVLKAEKERAA